MKTNDQQFARFDGTTFRSRRLIYFANEGKEVAPGAAQISEAETLEKRKQQARKEIDGIYELGEYDTYNFRKLPKEFKDHLKEDFGQWVDGNIQKYDEDKDSGINAREYEKFKTDLTKKVKGVLDRLAELKKEKKKEAEKVTENAEAAKEAQKRLEGIDVTRMDDKNLESADGTYTELLKYQKDFENEAAGFAKLTGVFDNTKEKADEANKSHHTGATAFGEYLVNIAPWAEDIPEVKTAKEAKERAINDFRTKLAEMKKRQKERQERGKRLNGTPEKLRGPAKEKYLKMREEVTTQLDTARDKKEENDDMKVETQKRLKENETARAKLQGEYDDIASQYYLISQKRKKAAEETAEIGKAEEGLTAAKEQIAARQKEVGGYPKPQLEEAAKKISKAKVAVSAVDLAMKEAGTGADIEIKKIGQSMHAKQTELTKLISNRVKNQKLEKSLTEREPILTGEIDKLEMDLGLVNKAEQDEMNSIDSLDEAISGTVLEVDTSNFELIKKGETHLKTLQHLDIKGPGLLDMMGAAANGIPGVEKTTDWTGNKLTKAWNWAKHAPVLGAGIEIVGYMGEGWTKGWDWMGKQLDDFSDWAHLPEAWDWMSEATKHMSIGHPTGIPAIDALLDTFSAGGAGAIIELFAGVTEGCKDLVKGLGIMARNPFDMMKGLAHLANHPSMIIEAFIQKDKWGDESTGKIIGRIMVDVVATLSGAGASATAVRTSIAAVRIGEAGVARAILLGVQTFGEVFVKDIAHMALGIVKLPGKAARGIGELVTTLANGGKKLEPVEGTAIAGAKKVASAEENIPFELKRKKAAPAIAAIAEEEQPLLLVRKKESAVSGVAGPAEVTKPAKKLSPEKVSQKAAAEQALAKEIADLEVVQDFSVKQRKPEVSRIFAEVEEKVQKNPVFKELQKKGLDFHWHAERLPDYDLKLLASRIDDLTPELMENILKQNYKKTINNDGRIFRYYEGQQLGKGGFGAVHDCAYVSGVGEDLMLGAMKRPRDIQSLTDEIAVLQKHIEEGRGKLSDAEIKGFRFRQVTMQFELDNLRDVFQRELRGMTAVKEMSSREGLLSPKVISARTLEETVIIYDKISDPSGREVLLNKRMVGDEPLEHVLGYIEDSLGGLDRLHSEGWIHLDYKPGNVFVGAAEGATRGHLGDLSLIHYTDLPFLEVMEIKQAGNVTGYAILKKGPSGLLRDSRQIAMTPEYFSAQHLQKLIAEAKEYFADLDRRGLSPKDAPVPKKMLTTGDIHQVGETLSRFRDLLDPEISRTKLAGINKKLQSHENRSRNLLSEKRMKGEGTSELEASLKNEKDSLLDRKKYYEDAVTMAEKNRREYGDAALNDARKQLDGIALQSKDLSSTTTVTDVLNEIREIRSGLEGTKKSMAHPPSLPQPSVHH